MNRIITADEQETMRSLITGRRHTDREIGRITGAHFTTVARYRRLLGLPRLPHPGRTAPTVEEQWGRRVRPADAEGHIEWSGALNSSGSPVFSYLNTTMSARAAAFSIRTSRAPIGYVKATCSAPRCVAPRHVEDGAERDLLAALLSTVSGAR